MATQALRIDYSLSLLERQLGQPRAAFLAQPELHWSVKGLRDEHAPALAHVLRSNKALQELGLARNQLTGELTLTLSLTQPQPNPNPTQTHTQTLILTRRRGLHDRACAARCERTARALVERQPAG